LPKRLTSQAYIDGVCSGDRVVLGRAITLVESTLASDRLLAAQVLEGCQARAGNSFRLGITGVPGVGKSTFIDAFGTFLTKQGHRLAVLAIDPSSEITQGSILGDKTRMDRLAHDPHAFIRPSPARGSLGGVTRATREAILLCEAAGFDFIIIETVGVGQSEVAVHSMVDFFLLLMLAGAGDELQGIKKGIMEMADGIAINKADGDNLLRAREARAEYESALHLFPMSSHGWQPRVLTCSAAADEGMAEIAAMLGDYRMALSSNGWLARRRREQARAWMHETIGHLLLDRFLGDPQVQAAMLEKEILVEAGKIPPTVAATQLIELYLQQTAK
jgi:LAO/AO transport system kinase